MREAWVTSPEYRRGFVALFVAIAVLALLVTLNGADIHVLGTIGPDLPTKVDTLLYTVAVGTVLLSYSRRQRRRFYDRRLITQEQLLNRREAELVNEEGTSIGELWQLTNERLRGYHERAYRQADQSFRNAQMAISGGFVIVAGTAGIAAWKTGLTTQSSVVVGVIGTVGAGLAAYIGRTFLRLQETTATHLRAYFDQPTETFRYLVAERLIDRLPEDQRVQTVEYLVQAVMLSGLPVEQAVAAFNAQQQNGQADAPGQAGGSSSQR